MSHFVDTYYQLANHIKGPSPTTLWCFVCWCLSYVGSCSFSCECFVVLWHLWNLCSGVDCDHFALLSMWF